MLRSIDRLVELGELMHEPAPFHSSMGCRSIDPDADCRLLLWHPLGAAPPDHHQLRSSC
jgi:hypothetical protein